MNLGDQIAALDYEIHACQEEVSDVLSRKSKIQATSNCCNRCKPVSIPQGDYMMRNTKANAALARENLKKVNATSNNRKPLTKPIKKQKKTVEKSEKFATNNANVDVKVKSTSKTPATLKISGIKPCPCTMKMKSCHQERLVPEKLNFEHTTLAPPKQKISWGNILKEQNRFHNNILEEEKREFSQNPAEQLVKASKQTRALIKGNEPSKEERNHTENGYIQSSASTSKSSNLNPTAFSSFNPVRTLQFLMGEFRAKVKKMEGSSIENIVESMESALQRIASNPAECGMSPLEGPIKDAPHPTNQSSNKVLEREVAMGGSGDKQVLQRKLEESCLRLEETCRHMEITCNRLREERDHLNRELAEKANRLEIALAKEVEYQARLAESSRLIEAMSAKGSHYTQSIQDLTQLLSKLQEENKMVGSLKEMQIQLTARLHDTLEENDRLSARVQILSLEKEKQATLMKLKESQLTKLRAEIQNLGAVATGDLSSSTTVDTSELSTTLDVSLRGFLSSSPNSSAISSSPVPYRSWQKMSTIGTEHGGGGEESGGVDCLKAELRGLFADLKREARCEEMASLSDITTSSTTITSLTVRRPSSTTNPHFFTLPDYTSGS